MARLDRMCRSGSNSDAPRLRHAGVRIAARIGPNVKAVHRMLGHSLSATTVDVYADLFDDKVDAVATVLLPQSALCQNSGQGASFKK